MNVGDIRYIVPWGMVVDNNRNCWLIPSYSVDTRPGGTVEMKIERREDGFHAWMPLDAKWNVREDSSCECSLSKQHIPVAVLHH